jgi:hypothetical protein
VTVEGLIPDVKVDAGNGAQDDGGSGGKSVQGAD